MMIAWSIILKILGLSGVNSRFSSPAHTFTELRAQTKSRMWKHSVWFITRRTDSVENISTFLCIPSLAQWPRNFPCALLGSIKNHSCCAPVVVQIIRTELEASSLLRCILHSILYTIRYLFFCIALYL